MRISTLLLVLTVFFGFGLKAADTLNYVGPDGKKQGYWIVTGKMLKSNPKNFGADAKVEEGRYKESQKVGLWINYFPNGAKQTEFTYVNNRPNGPAKIYYENGKVSEEGTWVGTRWVGPYKMYYEDGTPRQEFNYSTVGQREGKQVYKHPNGKVSIEVNMKGGKEEGWKKEYDEEGNLVRETYFNGGVIDPSKTVEHPVKTKSKDKGDKPDGAGEPPPPPPPPPAGTKWGGEGPYTLMKNGQVSQKGTFHLFKLVDGEAFFYDDNGMLVRIKKYKEGKYVGDSPIPADANK